MNIKARTILNSRGEKTIQVFVNGFAGSAPSGKSTSRKEVKPFKKSAEKEASWINNVLAKKLKNIEIRKFEDLEKIESLIRNLGGNSVVALEFALIKAFKLARPRSIPRPLGNVVGGGAHFKGKSTDFQEFLVLTRAESFLRSASINQAVYKLMHEELKKYKQFKDEKNDENAWVIDLSNIEVLDLLRKVVDKVKKAAKVDIRIGLDVAANSFYKNGYYYYRNFSKDIKNKKLTRKQQVEFIAKLIKDYNLYYIEDPLNENDGKGFRTIKKKTNALVVGDDLTSTNLKYLKKNKFNINGIIIKPNQIGSLIKMKEAVDYAKKNKITPIMSHRSGETLDNSISYLASSFNIPIIKCGITGRERLAKIKELIHLEKVL